MEKQAEPWLRGTLTEVPAVIRAVLHALELAREDVERWCEGLSDGEYHARPLELTPIAFHLRHIVRSLDRLLTYAEGRQLSAEQLALLKNEMEASGGGEELLGEFTRGLERAAERVRALIPVDQEQPRAIGKKALPTTAGGILVHLADHTQRHVGQVITTVKVVRAQRTSNNA